MQLHTPHIVVNIIITVCVIVCVCCIVVVVIVVVVMYVWCGVCMCMCLNRLPKWANVVQIIYFGWQVCDILVGLLSNTAPAKRLEELLQKFSKIGNGVKSVYDVRK